MPKVILVKGQNDLLSQAPDIAKDWHPSRNGIPPDQVFVRSSMKAWWLCSLGHEWEAKVTTRHESGCPYCTNRKILAGFNDLETRDPEVASLWHPEKNGSLTPREVSSGSSKRVWWLCGSGHEWQTSISNRTGQKTSCPFCSGRRRIEGENDLGSTHPNLLKLWDYERNSPHTPQEFSASSPKRVWWRCAKDHRFQRAVTSVALQGLDKCPYCSGRRVLEGLNDLATVAPSVAAEWHPTKNKNLKPTSVTAKNTSQQVWWQCSAGHEWQANIWNRVNGGTGCPSCTNRRLERGFNDLLSQHPVIAEEWSDRNLPLTPEKASIGLAKKVWWVCKRGHEWEAPIQRRVSLGTGCPFCSGTKLLEGFNDLATTDEALANEWHPDRNIPLLPSQISQGDHRKVWWQGSCGHEWRATVASRHAGVGCPVCAGKQVAEGFNDFESRFPQQSEEWDYEKNDLSPREVVFGSGKKYWWRCSEGHSWRASPSHRGTGRGCPSCSKGGFDPTKPGTLYFLHNGLLKAKKVGITNQDLQTSRIAQFESKGWSLIKTWNGRGAAIFETETIILRWIRKDLGIPAYLSEGEMSSLGGWSETFFEDAVADQVLIDQINQTYRDLQ